MSAVLDPALAQSQIDDLVELFAKTLPRWNLSALGSAVLGIDILREEGNSVGSPQELAAQLVKRLVASGRVPQAVALLQRESRHNGYLMMGLGEILAGRPLKSDNLQALLNRYEPFFNSADFQRMLPRVRSVVCAVAVKHQILGSGFLVGPDLVLTNHHVIESLLKDDSGSLVQNGSGASLEFVFDYQSEPPPRLNGAAPQVHSCVVVPAAEQWLVHARCLRKDDGTARALEPVDKELDYVVVRLARAIGKKPSRVSGGPMRGWLVLPAEECDYSHGRRVVVFQHPEGTAQQMDVGQMIQLDPTETRAWYRVSTAHGSSGGAAVDSSGELLALHNAAVDSPPGPPVTTLYERVNQGVRIDRIAKDLRDHAAGWQAPAPAEHHPMAIWSLTDSVENARPIIGRSIFRENVIEMTADANKRVMTVIGKFGTFARFTVTLLQRALGSQVAIARFTPSNMQTLPPEDFARALVEQLGIETDPQDRMPPSPPPTETLERWLALDLPGWVARQLARHAKAQPGAFPAWVVVDVTVPPNESVLWKAGLRDLVTGLVGVRDAGQTVNIPELRWVFLSTAPLPLGGTARLEEDIRSDDEVDREFAECMDLAWRSIDQSEPVPATLLRAMARKARVDNEARPATDRPPVRKALAAAVASLLAYAPTQ